MPARLVQLHRFPVKGLRHEPMQTAVLAPGQGLPGDRRFAVARGDTRWTADSPRWLPKQWFVMLMRDTALTRVQARVDGTSIALTMDGRDECRASWATSEGRTRLDDWLNDVLGPRREGRARLVEAGETSLTDVPQNCLSLLNLESA